MAGAKNGQEQAQRRRQGQALWSALALAILMGLYWATPVFQPLERRVYDAAATSVAPQPLPEIAIIAIDDASLARLGPWPWPHQLLNQLTAAGAKTIVHTSVFHTPQTDPAVRSLPLLLRHEGVGVPSLVLLAAAQSLHLAMDDVQRVPGPGRCVSVHSPFPPMLLPCCGPIFMPRVPANQPLCSTPFTRSWTGRWMPAPTKAKWC